MKDPRKRKWRVCADKSGNRLDMNAPGKYVGTKRHLDGRVESREFDALSSPEAVSKWKKWVAEP